MDENERHNTEPLSGWQSLRLGLIGASLIFAVFALIRAGFGYHEASVLSDDRVVVNGQVGDVEHRKGKQHARVRFTTRDGRAVSAEVSAWKDLPAEGDRVTVCYARRDPESYVQDARICPNFAGPRSETKFALVLLAFAAALWLPGLLRRLAA
ncbi:DUF3592 domain-containing protein [Actinomadura sp. NAK00032]|uniref:DUF3592 domain-containing protein n=1 Tax=Actinomadura sp. NAK00032 TaxID=2742128 RepID=UPI0015902E10|nr:DUF3592 domain-containing protein [Actinomadura sp. NAK00032]QKW39758.1 DUF3592 domain-containing protein [Actinomadura sp. NAK00032]